MTTAELTVRPLDASTWPDFARLVEADNGVFGGCWCMGFHPEGVLRGRSHEDNRTRKQERVSAGLGGGVVEGYPEDVAGVPAGFLFNGALSNYERLGFARERKIGKPRWVVRTTVPPR